MPPSPFPSQLRFKSQGKDMPDAGSAEYRQQFEAHMSEMQETYFVQWAPIPEKAQAIIDAA